MNHIAQVVSALLSTGARRAVKYLSETETVVAARPMYQGRRPRKNGRSTTVVVTFGKPNYEARAFIKRAKKAGEPFPIRKVQLKFPKP